MSQAEKSENQPSAVDPEESQQLAEDQNNQTKATEPSKQITYSEEERNARKYHSALFFCGISGWRSADSLVINWVKERIIYSVDV